MKPCGRRHFSPAPSLQSKAFLLFKRGIQRQSFAFSQSCKTPWQKGPFQPLGSPIKDNLLPSYFRFFSVCSHFLLHTRTVLLMHISQSFPFAILWYFTDLSWRTLNSACMKLTQKVHYNYRCIIRPKDQTRIRPKLILCTSCPWLANIDTVLLTAVALAPAYRINWSNPNFLHACGVLRCSWKYRIIKIVRDHTLKCTFFETQQTV